MRNLFKTLLLLASLLGVEKADAFSFPIGVSNTFTATPKSKEFKRTFRFEHRKADPDKQAQADLAGLPRITLSDFATHLREGTKRRYIGAQDFATAKFMDVGMIDWDGETAQTWVLPSFDGGTIDSARMEHVSVASTGYEGYYPAVTHAISYPDAGEYEFLALEDYELFNYGYTETDGGVQDVVDYYVALSPVPLAIGESYTGYVLFTYSDDPNYDSTLYTQEYDVVGYGTLVLPNGKTTQALKLHFTETETDYLDGEIISDTYYDEMVWYSKEGYYLRVGIPGDLWDSEGMTEINYIEYQEITEPVHCSITPANASRDWLQRVRMFDERGFVVLDNISGKNQGYGDYTAGLPETTLDINASYRLALHRGFRAGDEAREQAYAIWIDFNQDGDFDDFDEWVYSRFLTDRSVVRGTIDIPFSATLGQTVMRVAMRHGGVPHGPCYSFMQGETEDYAVTITENLGLSRQEGSLAREAAEAGAIEGLSIYPNPASETALLRWADADGPVQVEVFSLDGRRVLQATAANGEHALSVSDLEAGLYLVAVTDAQGRRMLSKLQVE